MKSKQIQKRRPVKLDLEKIEIDVLSNSILNGIQGGYLTQPGTPSCKDGACGHTLETQFPAGCYTTESLGTQCGRCCTGPTNC